MNADDLRAGAEVLKWDCDYNLDYITPAHGQAARRLSDSVLAELDPTPVTEEYCKRVGRTMCNRTYIIDEVSSDFWIKLYCYENEVYVFLNHPVDENIETPIVVQTNPTICQFRTLCRGLGIELKG